MKAILFHEYGAPKVLQLTEVEKPTPKENELLIKVHATTVFAGDTEVRASKIPRLFWLPFRLYMGLFRPRFKILGQEFSGMVEAVGSKVTRYQVGEKIFGPSQIDTGTYAEYICLPEKTPLVEMPENSSFGEAATIPTGGLNALYFIRMANIKKGEKVLFNGAGGSIGTYAVQLAKYYGAEVTAVDNAQKLKMLKLIGADHVIDFEKEDFTANGEKYDVIIDGPDKCHFYRTIKCLKVGGRFININIRLRWTIKAKLISFFTDKKLMTGLVPYKKEDLEYLKNLMEGEHLKAVIDREYPLEKMCEAHTYVDKNLKKGHVVVNVVEK